MRRDRHEPSIKLITFKCRTCGVDVEVAKVACGDCAGKKTTPERFDRKKAINALLNLLEFIPEIGFPSNVQLAYGSGMKPKERKAERATLNTVPFLCEAWLYQLMGKEDARTVLALVGKVAKGLGLEGLHDAQLSPRTEEQKSRGARNHIIQMLEDIGDYRFEEERHDSIVPRDFHEKIDELQDAIREWGKQ